MASIGQELLNVPFPEMVKAMGMAIAQAQYSLDMNSIRIAQVMSGSPWLDVDAEGEEVVREGLKVNFGGRQLSLLELGFTPTFYQFVDTVIEVKISMSMKTETEERRSSSSTSFRAAGGFFLFGGGMSASVSTVSASFAARNSFSAEGASLIRTKLVPLPAPAVLQERIRAMLEESRKSEIVVQPAVLEIKSGESASVTVSFPAPVEVTSTPAAPVSNKDKVATGAFENAPSSGKIENIKVKVTAGAETGVATLTLTIGPRRGEIKVLVVKA